MHRHIPIDADTGMQMHTTADTCTDTSTNMQTRAHRRRHTHTDSCRDMQAHA